MSNISQWLKSYLNRRILVVFLLGFSSGLPIALVGGTLQAWFKTTGASVIIIGYMTLITQPYSYKFLWAPLLDKFCPLASLDKRRSWLLLMQLCVTVFVIAMAYLAPNTAITVFGLEVPVLFILGFVMCFCSATQDIAIDAYRVEILKSDERGLGSALGIEGYRLAMVISGGFALMLADRYGWHVTYLCMASLMLIGIIATILAPAAPVHNETKNSKLSVIISTSFKDFLLRDKAWLLLLLIVFYKLGDAFSHALSTAFLLDLNFSLSETGLINKVIGVIATLIGVLIGGLFMTRVGLYKAMLTFGILAAVTNLTYMLLAMVGKNFTLACSAVLLENICAGMGTAALVAFIMSVCNPLYTATQFALLSSLTSVGRIYVGPISGYIVDIHGWETFYLFSAVVAVPALLLLVYLKPQITKYESTFGKAKMHVEKAEPKFDIQLQGNVSKI